MNSIVDNIQKRILVAEDEDSLREMFVIIFEDEGYLVDAAENGEQAWELINKNHYDLLVTDLYMPKMNGFELILQVQESFPALKIILVSGGGREVSAEHGKGAVTFNSKEISIDMFFKKPGNLDELVSVAEELLE